MGRFTGVLLLTIILFANGQGPERHMICKDLSNIFENDGQSRPSGPEQGRPGKIGPVGPKGEIGPRGPPGSVEYERVREIVRQEIQAGLSNVNERVDILEMKINKIRESQQSSGLSREEEEECLEEYAGILYNGSCLWAQPISQRVDIVEALATCNKRTRSKLPEIYGQSEYSKIVEYLRSNKKEGTGIAFTAMTRNHATGQALMSDGSVAPYQKIRSAGDQWTEAEERRTNVYVYARDDPNDADQGFGSIWPEYRAKDLLCQTTRV